MHIPLPFFVLFFSLLLFGTSLAQKTASPSFKDVTNYARIDLSKGAMKKYGSPSVVDLDRDGYFDLLFCHHDSHRTETYFNNANGTFTKSTWGIYDDSHGFAPFPVSPSTKNMRFSLSVGGNYGMDLATPLMFEVDAKTRDIGEVTKTVGIDKRGGRGRTAVYLDLSLGAHPQWPDVIFINAFNESRRLHHFAYENNGNKGFQKRTIEGNFEHNTGQFAALTDIDNDGVMEVMTYWGLQVWKIVAPYKMVDISLQVLPPDMERRGVKSIAEIDFDNDGDMDLYIANTRVGWWLPDIVYNDMLLENRNGTYHDVSINAGIPRASSSRGVTVGDFNNDGWLDLHVTMYTGSDELLLNNGDGTFRRETTTMTHASSTRGDNSVAADYDNDGRVDLVVSEGDQDKKDYGGTFHVLRNEMPMSSNTNYIHVRVGNEGLNCTPLNAVVTVKSGTLSMTRRVGSPGTTISPSYLEILHFGLGERSKVDSIEVKYTNGKVLSKKQMMAGQTVVIGQF